MELLQGRSLGAVVADEGPLPPRRAVHLLLQTARALGEAHRAGTVHRDIKPDNLFVTDLGGEADFIKVLDFGIAKMQEADRDIELTGPGFVAGTPAYISPEVATGQPADARSDVYGLGGTLYYALTGTLPFLAETAHEMFVKHLREELEPPSKRIDRPVPPDVEAVIMRCMEKQPEDRFADANEVADALADCEVADEPHDIVAERAPTQPRMPALARRTAHYKE
jgi:serine/threonine-protein kinase